MLENKDAIFENGKIVAIRIVTGDELIGEVTAFDKGSVTLKKPCGLQVQPQTGHVGLAPATMLGSPEADVIYQRSAIIAIMKPRADAEKSYKEYATGLVVPQKEGIVLPK